jgi:hypothetical protein
LALSIDGIRVAALCWIVLEHKVVWAGSETAGAVEGTDAVTARNAEQHSTEIPNPAEMSKREPNTSTITKSEFAEYKYL